MKNPFRKKDSSPFDELEVVTDSTPVIKYANLLLYQMVKTGKTDLVLRSTEPLEPIPLKEGGNLEPPEFNLVLNRFKVMSGHVPMHYAKDTEGKIKLYIRGERFDIKTIFNDDSENLCRIELIETD